MKSKWLLAGLLLGFAVGTMPIWFTIFACWVVFDLLGGPVQ
jgi:hypothetical protein